MTGRMLLRLSPMALVLALAACGGGGGGASPTTAPTTTTTTTAPAETTSLRVYFLKDGRVQPVAREVPKTRGVAAAALHALQDGPLGAERDAGFLNGVSSDWGYGDLTIANGTAVVHAAGALAQPALAQLVYTLTQFPTVKAVEIGGRRYTRADFEQETPIILVESPLPYQHVKSPLRARGTANTFEATFNYDLVDPHGTVIATHFVTASSGSGQRGTFDFSVPFQVDKSGLGKLVVYERSAANGQRIHQGEIPVYLEQ